MVQYLIAQVIGFIAFVVFALSFWSKNRRVVLILEIIECFFYAIHYILIGSTTGAVINFVGMFRSWSFMFKGKNKFTSGLALPIIFIVSYLLNGVLTWEGVITLVPTIASVIFCLVIWQHNTKNIRRLGLVTQSLWLIYAIYLNSFILIFSEAFLFVSTTIAIIRLDILKQKLSTDFKIKVNVFPNLLEKIYDRNSKFIFDRSAIRNPNYMKFVCTVKNKPVGYIALYPHSDFMQKKGFPVYQHTGPFSVFVWQVIIDPVYERMGVATLLMDEIKRIYEGYEIYALNNANNRPGSLFYSTLGFSKKMDFERVHENSVVQYDLLQYIPKLQETYVEPLRLEFQNKSVTK